MIVLDTNVLSELMRATPSAKVVGWIEARLATRNVKDFEGCEIKLLNPWG